MKLISQKLLDLVCEIEALEGENEELKDRIIRLKEEVEDAYKPL